MNLLKAIAKRLAQSEETDFPVRPPWPPEVGNPVLATIYESDDDGDSVADSYVIRGIVTRIKNYPGSGDNYTIKGPNGRRHECALENLRSIDSKP